MAEGLKHLNIGVLWLGGSMIPRPPARRFPEYFTCSYLSHPLP